MANQSHIDQMRSSFENFKIYDYNTIHPQHNWNGYTYEDVKGMYNELRRIFELALNRNYLIKPHISINFINSMNSYFNSLPQIYQQISASIGNPAALDSHFSGALSTLDAALAQLRTYGIVQFVDGTIDFEEENKNINLTKDKLSELLNEAVKINEESKNTLLNANSGVISSAFEKRKRAVAKSKNFWLIFTIACIIATVLVALYTILPYVDEYNKSNRTNKAFNNSGSQKPNKTSDKGDNNEEHYASGIDTSGLFVGLSMRITGLAPLLLLIIFSINQYNKERDFEEQYAHRESVSASIPGYHKIISDQNVKDQMAKDATGVIFSLPTLSKSEKLETKALGLLEKISRIVNNRT
ncbi:hypothetical protein [Leptospira haakeii]|uniref:Uncharacterized protein n=1 Tax=Leptospira haakeii TaxID=2023198 RepID=A0ABX4PIM0_9LEPT|nr:hypothetical protein [Leptospira haakeii]PKA15460.1 hypothetical protein CH363_12655 [Leptospira haakeii]PKA18363.1 hypothetical protein CH377_18075 [Leptospira haakeii]